MTQHFQPYAADTFACGVDAFGQRNSRLDSDPTITTCLQCKNTDTWRHGWQHRIKNPQEIRLARFDAALRKSADAIPDSQYVALVEGKVRMGLTTYEALVNAATKTDDQSSPPEEVVHHYTPGGWNVTCGKRIGDNEVKDIERDWAKVTCPDCVSHYAPENDTLAPGLTLAEGERDVVAIGNAVAYTPGPHDPEPVYEHDCDYCIFLGSETVGGKMRDLYFHPATIGGGRATVLARESSDPGDYRSGMGFVDRDGALALAFIRAQRKGLLR